MNDFQHPKLVNLMHINKTFRFDLRYATTNNFTVEKLYQHPLCLLRENVAQDLSRAQDEFQKQGLALCIWDGYRPTSVQAILRSVVNDDHFVSSISNHSRSIAVDVTLCHTDGTALSMPTGFDDFSPAAHSEYIDLTDKQLQNRALLTSTLANHGFQQDEYEWWHFDHTASLGADVIELEI